MRPHVKLAIAALIVAAALAALVGSASAGRLSTGNQSVRVAWSSLEFTAGGTVVRCGLTLEGSFHSRTIAKVERGLIGYATRAILQKPCTNGTVFAYNGTEVLSGTTLPNTLPWHITYEGFAGTLPAITSLRLLLSGARFLAEILGTRCVYTTGAGGNITGTATRDTTTGVVDNLRASGSVTPDENPFCPTGSYSSRAEDGSITVLASTNRITITLI